MPPKSRKRLSGSDADLSKTSENKKKKVEQKTTLKNEGNTTPQEKLVSPTTSKAKDPVHHVRRGDSPKAVKKSPVKTKKNVEKPSVEPIKNINDLDINQLLALGENFKPPDTMTRDSDSDFSDENADFEEVKNTEISPEIPKEGVSIVLEMPNLRKKKGGFDAEAHVRREINRVRKGIQLLMHQVHVLCWIAHLKYINSILNSSSLMKSCVALIKSKNLYPPKYSDISYLEGVIKWFHKTIELQVGSVEPECSGGVLKELMYQVENKKVYSYRDFILIFVTLLRILGLKARIIMSFQVLPVKPLSSELLDSKSGKDLAKENKSKNTKPDNVSQEVQEKNEGESSKGKNSIKDVPVTHGRGKEKKSANSSDTKENKKVKDSKLEEGSCYKKSKKIKRNKESLKVSEQRKNTKKAENLSDVTDDDEDFKADSLNKKPRKKSERKSTSSNDDSLVMKKKEGSNVWTEVFIEAEEKWISVDVVKKKIHCINELYSRATHPVTYIMAGNNDLTLKDVTKRYVPHWHSETKKKRVDEVWWDETMKPYLPKKTAFEQEEDDDIARQLHDQPLPSVISEYKDHPLYALKRHLLKFEAIYPPEAPTLGFVRGEPVYARECVHTLHSREMWYKQARVVRLKEEPYKIVKARPKYDKMTGEVKKDLPLELFGKWQTEDYIPPLAVDGKVPRNEYGNVDLFLPCMLPLGTVHLQIPALNKVARKLGIDCAPATVGFEFHSGGSHPVFDGFVVCEEFKDILLDTWNKEVDESAKRNEEKKEKRVYSNWKRLIRGLLIREKLKLKYAFGDQSQGESSSSSSTQRSIKPSSPKAQDCK